MTAINVVCQRDAVHILSDGSVYARSAPLEPLHLTSKVWAMPHLNAAVAVSGSGVAGPALHWILSGAASFDHMKAGAIESMKIGTETIGQHHVDTMAIVAGFSETEGPNAFMISNCGQSLIGPDAKVATPGKWEMFDLGLFGVFPGNDRIYSKIPEAFSHLSSHEEFDPVCDGMGGIGGYVQLTSVTRESISTRIIYRWSEDQKAMTEAWGRGVAASTPEQARVQ